MSYFTNLSLEFALDTLELVVGVDVVAEDDPCVRGEGAQVAVVDLGGGSQIQVIIIQCIINSSNSSKLERTGVPCGGRNLDQTDHRDGGLIIVLGVRYESSSSQAS